MQNEHFILLKIGGNQLLQYSLCSSLFKFFLLWFGLNNYTDNFFFSTFIFYIPIQYMSMLLIMHAVCSALCRADFLFTLLFSWYSTELWASQSICWKPTNFKMQFRSSVINGKSPMKKGFNADFMDNACIRFTVEELCRFCNPSMTVAERQGQIGKMAPRAAQIMNKQKWKMHLYSSVYIFA